VHLCSSDNNENTWTLIFISLTEHTLSRLGAYAFLLSVKGNSRYIVPEHLCMKWNYIIINTSFLRLSDYVKSRSQK
jgi:hypothetical protein